MMSWPLWYNGWPVFKDFPGHKGRPGQRGGSLPRGVVASRLSALSSPTGYRGKSENLQIGKWLGESTPKSWSGATDEERMNLKAQVAKDLANATGVSEHEAADFVRQWAESSNDNDMRSLAIQQDAAKEFGVEVSEFTQSKIDAIEQHLEEWPSHKDALPFNPLMESDEQRALLRAMYDNTQAELKARGITEVRLYRGVGFDTQIGKKGDVIRIETNTVESWSIGEDVGRSFELRAEGKYGFLFESIIPAERILATPATGFGCLTEGEVVVLGGVDGDAVKIIEVRG